MLPPFSNLPLPVMGWGMVALVFGGFLLWAYLHRD